MRHAYLYLLLLVGATLCACRSTSPQSGAAIPGKLATNAFTAVAPMTSIQQDMLNPSVEFFRLGPGDVVEIEVIGGKEAVATATVGPDGKIYYSLLPGLFVWGLSLAEARQLIEENLAKFLRERPE